jgi:hypothetical protein
MQLSAGRQVAVSANGGTHFSADGWEIFYRGSKSHGRGGEGGRRVRDRRARLSFRRFSRTRNRFVPSGDGQRFLIVAPLGRDAMAPTTVVLNWFAGLGK